MEDLLSSVMFVHKMSGNGAIVGAPRYVYFYRILAQNIEYCLVSNGYNSSRDLLTFEISNWKEVDGVQKKKQLAENVSVL